MKTLYVIVFSFIVLMSSCTAQTKKETEAERSLKSPPGKTAELATKPDIRFKVNKKYDDKGHVIAYDSTYSYSYSGGPMNADTKQMFGDLKSYFDSPSGFFGLPGNSPTPSDSTFLTPFDDRYFQKQMEMNQKLMDAFLKKFNAIQPALPSEKSDPHTTHKTI